VAAPKVQRQKLMPQGWQQNQMEKLWQPQIRHQPSTASVFVVSLFTIPEPYCFQYQLFTDCTKGCFTILVMPQHTGSQEGCLANYLVFLYEEIWSG
jgi:hypothetical protein